MENLLIYFFKEDVPKLNTMIEELSTRAKSRLAEKRSYEPPIDQMMSMMK